MEGVRVVTTARQNNNNAAEPQGQVNDVEQSSEILDATSQRGDATNVPLHEELTAVARAFETRVRFEKVRLLVL